ncbi:MAG TPA: 50S ribosomal protein L23 [Bdellovibrionota bacterium]|nr:50S ribosomal protein L23 [Bdellovibrionota bacterium]
MSAELGSVIRRPIITEKSTKLREKGNQVVFEVSKHATKPQIREAIEKAFKVKVKGLNTLVVRGKFKQVGRYAGKRASWKKAIATLREGDKIELFEGV